MGHAGARPGEESPPELRGCVLGSPRRNAGGGLLPATRIGRRPGSPTRAIMVFDPDGTRLELFQGLGDPNAVPGSSGWLVE